MKVLLTATDANLLRFRNEARAVNAIGHPNIPLILDSGSLRPEPERVGQNQQGHLPMPQGLCLKTRTSALWRPEIPLPSGERLGEGLGRRRRPLTRPLPQGERRS